MGKQRVHLHFWKADRFCFEVKGRHAQKFLSEAAQRGMRLYRVRCIPDGYRAFAAGRDHTRIQALTGRGGWTFSMVTRHGPGILAERAALRPGVPVGIVLFLCLIRFLSSFVWSIDFGRLDSDEQKMLRPLLAAHAIYEGAHLDEDELREAQRALMLESGDMGWLSLNFAGGCLYIESTASEKQQIAQAASNTALYATEDALVLSIHVDSGFTEVVPGQMVAKGQLLAASAKRDRSGNAVGQAATGEVIGRIVKVYTASCSRQSEAPVLTGASLERKTMYLLGKSFASDEENRPYADYECQEDWAPLTLGRLALPASICSRTYLERKNQTQNFSLATANAMARRMCNLQIYTEHPDAIIETREESFDEQEERSICTIKVTYRANIAVQEENHTELPPLTPE